jgi:hypothetical protein
MTRIDLLIAVRDNPSQAYFHRDDGRPFELPAMFEPIEENVERWADGVVRRIQVRVAGGLNVWVAAGACLEPGGALMNLEMELRKHMDRKGAPPEAQ